MGLKLRACVECSSNIWGSWLRVNDRGAVGDGVTEVMQHPTKVLVNHCQAVDFYTE